MRFNSALLFLTLLVLYVSSTVAVTCKCMKSLASITRNVCNALSYMVGTDDKYTEYGRTTCYNLAAADPNKYFIPKCKDLGGTSWKCY